MKKLALLKSDTDQDASGNPIDAEYHRAMTVVRKRMARARLKAWSNGGYTAHAKREMAKKVI
jgi:hypothetical protein